jgi:hypothetical protein
MGGHFAAALGISTDSAIVKLGQYSSPVAGIARFVAMSMPQPLLYQRVAGLVAGQISSGALRASERIPSVRSMSRAARVSVSTVVRRTRTSSRSG